LLHFLAPFSLPSTLPRRLPCTCESAPASWWCCAGDEHASATWLLLSLLFPSEPPEASPRFGVPLAHARACLPMLRPSFTAKIFARISSCQFAPAGDALPPALPGASRRPSLTAEIFARISWCQSAAPGDDLPPICAASRARDSGEGALVS